MKHNNKTFALLFFLLTQLIAVPSTRAQAFIRENPNFPVDHTIVRDIDDSTWLVYSMYNNRATFTKVSRSGYVTPVMDLGSRTVVITDFEILGNKVFFCGTTYEIPTEAVFGSFKLTAFPNSLVEYTRLAEYTSFDRLEVLAQDRCLLIGKTIEEENHFIEVQETYAPTSWSFYAYSGLAGIVEKLDDVAGSGSYAVFTGRSLAQNKGYVFFADYASAGWLANPQPIQYLEYSYRVISPLWLEYCQDNYFATATLSDDILMHVSAYSAPNHFSTQKVITGYGITRVCDVKYKKDLKRLEVLTHHSEYDYFASKIFHFEQNLINPNAGTVTAHSALDYWLTSLDDSPMSYPGGLYTMVTTGFNYGGDLSFHRYNPTASRCWEKEEIKVNDLENNRKPVEINLERTRIKVYPEPLPTTSYYHEMERICY